MSFGKKLLNVFLVMILLALLVFGLSNHYFDDILNLIAVGVPMWIFLIMIFLIANVYNQSRIISSLDTIRKKLDQPQYYPEEIPNEEQ